MAVDTLCHLLALHLTATSVDDRAEVAKLTDAVQNLTGETFDLIYVDKGYTGEKLADAAKQHGIDCAWSSLPRPRRDLSCCPSAGPANARSPG